MRPLSLLLLFLLALASCHSPTDPLEGRISGAVTDQYGHLWGGVSVGMVTEQGVVATALTNDHGRYSIHSLHTGHYRVWLQLGRTGPGYFVGEIDLHPGDNTFDIVTH